MDISKFKTHDWLVIGGAAAVLVFTFMKWWKVDIPFGGGSYGTTGFDHFFTGIVPWLLIVAAGVLTFLAAAGIFTLPDSIPKPLVFLAATALGTVLILLNLLIGPGIPSGVDRGIGLFLSLLGGIVATAGAAMSFTASGGDFKDLTDPNKLKAAFDSDGGGSPASGGSNEMPPPPPPAGS